MFGSFRDRALSPAGLPLVPFSLCLRLEPLLRRIKNEKASPALRGVHFAGCVRATISAFPPTRHTGCKEGG